MRGSEHLFGDVSLFFSYRTLKDVIN